MRKKIVLTLENIEHRRKRDIEQKMGKIDYKWIALSCTTLGALISVLSGSTLLIALPEIMKELHTDLNVIMWTVMIYMLVLTIIVPSIGRVADIIGRKKLYVSGFVVFTIGSVFCGFSSTALQLIMARFIQSVGGALLVANSAPIVTDAFPKNELGKALGINGMVISVASVIGPILGGLLLGAGWRFIFFINIPIGVIGTVWAALQLREVEHLPEKQKFDFKGTAAFTIGMTALLLALTMGGFNGWFTPVTVSLFSVSIIFMIVFIIIENKAEQPMLDLRLLKTKILAFAYASTLLNGIARGAVSFLLIFYFQGIKGINPITSAILLVPFALSMMIMSPISGRLSDRLGSRGLSFIGLLISALGLLGMVRISEDTTIMELAVWMFISGFGSGMFFSPNTSAIMGAVPVERRGIAAGVRTMMNNAGNVLSIALSMAIISSSMKREAFENLFTGIQVGSYGIAVDTFIGGLRTVFAISFIISLAAAFISFLRGPQPKWEEQIKGYNLRTRHY